MRSHAISPTLTEELSGRSFRALADAIPHLVWSRQPDGQSDYFNRRLYEYTGLSHEQLAGLGWMAIIHPEDLERCRAAWDRAVADGSRYEVEYRLRRHDGVYRWHYGSAEPVRENGRIVRWFGTCTDIDARKQAEQDLEQSRLTLEEMVAARTESLRESEARLRAIIANEPECVKLLDAEGRLLEMNSAGLRMIEADDIVPLLGRSVCDVVAPEHQAAFRALTERVCRGERGTLEFEIVGLKGTRRWLQTHAVPFRDARGDTRLLGITRDITDRKRAEQALAESEQRFRSLAELSSDWYWEQDEELRFVKVAPRLETLMGFSARPDVGKTRWEMPALGVSPEQWAEHRRTLEAHLPFRDFEYQRLNDRGELVWLSVSGEPMFDPDGRFRGYRGIGRNLTEGKRAQQALARSEQRFRSFMDNLPAVAWIKDSQLRYAWVSSRYETVHARPPGEIIGRDDFELWPAKTAEQFRGVDLQALEKNRPVQTTDQIPFADGSKAHWLVVKFPLPDASGRMGVGGMRIDITERVALEGALLENQARVEAATQTVRTLMNRLVNAQEAERRKLAADLHDLIGQKLTALGLNVDIVRRRVPQAGALAIAPHLHQMSLLLEETIGAIRTVMSDLQPQALDEHGLSAALYQYAATFEARTGLRVRVKGAEARRPLPHDVSIALFRIAQEALTNAAKHSGASRALVRVRKSERRVELVVEDDGRGLGGENGKAPDGNGGWGLRMMRERAEAVGGQFSLADARPGTRVAVAVPLNHAD